METVNLAERLELSRLHENVLPLVDLIVDSHLQLFIALQILLLRLFLHLLTNESHVLLEVLINVNGHAQVVRLFRLVVSLLVVFCRECCKFGWSLGEIQGGCRWWSSKNTLD
jgi:hypothetical protein